MFDNWTNPERVSSWVIMALCKLTKLKWNHSVQNVRNDYTSILIYVQGLLTKGIGTVKVNTFVITSVGNILFYKLGYTNKACGGRCGCQADC